jgi:hypothetical protein
MVDLGVSRSDCLPGVERCIEGMSVLGRGVSVCGSDVLCLCQPWPKKSRSLRVL